MDITVNGLIIVLVLILPTIAMADQYTDAINVLSSNSASKELSKRDENSVSKELEQDLPGFSNFRQGGKTAKEKAIYQDLQGLENNYLQEIDSYELNQSIDPIHTTLQQKQGAMQESDESPNLMQTMQLTGKDPVTHKTKFRIRSTDPLLKAEDNINNATYDEAMGTVKIPAVDSKTFKKENHFVTCLESAEPVETKQTMSLYIKTKVVPAQEKEVIVSIRNHWNPSTNVNIDLINGKFNSGVTTAGGSSIQNPLGDWANEPGLRLEYLGHSYNGIPRWHDSCGRTIIQPTRSNNFIFSFNVNGGCAFWWNGNFEWKMNWRASVPEKAVFESESWVPSDPVLVDFAKQGVCNLINDECIEGPATRNVHGLSFTRECWKRTLTYECGGGSNTNGCADLEQKGCWQVNSKCSKQAGPFPIEFEQTFECPGGEYQTNTGLTLNGDGLKLQTGADPMTGEGFDSGDFAEAIGKFNLVKEMKKGLVEDPDDPEAVRLFTGKPMSCEIHFGSGIKNCCRLKGLLLNVIGGSCPKDVKETLAPAVVREKRCQLIQEKYCVKKAPWGCRKWRTTYCCFNSKLGKIFQQIAHMQLGIPWGTGDSPNCASLNPADFEKLNFDTPEAQTLLADVINDAQNAAESNFQLAQQKLAARADLTERVKEMQNNLTDHMNKKFPGRPGGIQK